MTENCRIMIIDDEFIMRQGIRYMMNWEQEGYEVVGEASNGKEALDRLEELKPDIILCDIAMPVMDGLDFIKIVRKKYPDIQILVLSSYDRFDYVRQALLNGAADYVLKPTLNPEMLLNMVSKAAQKIPGLQLKKKEFSSLDTRLEQYFTGNDEKIKQWEFQEVFTGSCFRLFVLPLRRRDKRGTDLSPVLYEKAEEMLKEQGWGTYLKFVLNQETLCIVFNYSVKDEKRMLECMETMMEQLSVLYEQCFGILGPKRTDLESLKEDFEKSGILEEESFYHEGIHLYIQQEWDKRETCGKFDFRRFVEYLGEHKYEDAIKLFHKYLLSAGSCRVPEFKLKNQAKNLLYNILSSTEEQTAELEELRKEYFEKIEKSVYYEEFREVLEELTVRLKDILLRGEGQDVYLKEILEYIQIHYKEEMDLQSLAETFGFNYSYLSAYFNSHMGEGLSEYLNRIRIEKACSYLGRKEYSIAQVSAMVGYSDHSYFCRVFKKVTGKTPSVYRRERWKRI